MFGPPLIPAQEWSESIFKKPAVMISLVQTKHGNRSHWRLGAVTPTPTASLRMVRHESLGRRFAQGRDRTGIAKVWIGEGCHCGCKKSIPVEDHIAAPIHAP